MKTKTYEVYKFNELPEEAKTKVLENYRDLNTDNNWYEFEYEYWYDKLEALGYKNVDISFSGFWSQGDGASFTADIDLMVWLKSHKKLQYFKPLIKHIEAEEVTAKSIRISHQYSHYNTCQIEVSNECELDKEETKQQLLVELERMLEEERKQLSKDIYKQLENTYNGLTEDEAIIETIEANDYDFTLDGKID